MSNSGDSLLPVLSNAIAGLVASAAASVVAVHAQRTRASGFVWKPGLVVCSSESLADDDPVEIVLPGGEVAPATLKGRDAATDIALLRIEHAQPPSVVATTDDVAAGALTMIVGADEAAPLAALGVVSRVGGGWRSMRGGQIDARIEIDATVRGRAEGGLALDASGRAIGMVVFGPRRRVLVIPWRTLDRVVTQLDAHGRIARGYLGLGLQPVRIEGDTERAGAMVMTVDAGGPGAAAGIRQGDIIVDWDGNPITGIRSVWRELGPDSVGAVVRLSARRAGAAVQFDVTIGARPDG